MRQKAEIHRTIPTGWLREKLGNLADKITKGATPTTYGYEFQRSGINFIKIQNVFSGTIDLATITDFISEEAHQNQKKSILRIDDVLFSIAGTIGETSIVKPQHLPANTNQAFAIISGFSELLLPKYLEFQLRSFVSQKTKEKARGGAMNNVSLEDLKHLELLLPPLSEQYRIVAKIEELFSELDKGIENLKITRVQLKVYRQALLKHAFEGKLTAQWRAANHDKLETADALLKRIQQERAQRYQQQLADWEANGGSKPKAPKTLSPLTKEELAELPELPEGWGWVRYGDLCSHVRNGISAKPEGDTGTPIFRISAVRPLFFDMTDIRFIDNTTGEFDAYCLERGDLVFTRYNGSRRYVGVCAEYRSDEKRLFPDKLVQTRIFSKNMSTSYLEKALNSGASRKFVESKIRTTAGQSGVSGDDIKNIPVPFCPTDEQIQIVEELESKLSEVDQLEQTIATSLQQAEALRQSILKKAFSGQLVPQDPDDEPATVLLERIRAERDKSINVTKKVRML